MADNQSDKWREYDPSWLVELAAAQLPDEPWLQEALQRCTSYLPVSEAYIRFVPFMDAKVKESIVLEHPEMGDVVLDILRDRRVSGVEFVQNIPHESTRERTSPRFMGRGRS